MECNKIKLRGPWIILIETTEFHPKVLLNDPSYWSHYTRQRDWYIVITEQMIICNSSLEHVFVL